MIGCFFDLEATGLDTKEASVVEIAYTIENLATQQNFGFWQSYVKTPNPLSEETTRITGITQEQIDVAGLAPMDALKSFLERIQHFGVTHLIAHNLHNYDLPLIKEELTRQGLTLPLLNFIDTKTDLPYKEDQDSRKLKYLAADHGFLNMKAHSALFDVATMVKLFYMYPLDKILELSESPTLRVKIMVGFNDRDEAKKRKYQWNPEKKTWEKDIKKIFLEKERLSCSPFQVIELERTA